ncbi:MAG TPA: NUDIX domain-containing protein, partial [Polyangiaceae bacterium]|nr:NUDIX domain-containing protein [Polyangiaceae bacterium]
MTRKTSAGLLMHRRRAGTLEVLLVHPGGPLWRDKDDGAWSIPKGELDAGEAPLDAARREFTEETGLQPEGPFLELAPVTLRSGKLVRAWAVAGDCDPTALRSITFRMEWPPHSGHIAEFPEVDRATFFSLSTARRKLNPGQVPLLDDLLSKLETSPRRGHPGLPFACCLVAL